MKKLLLLLLFIPLVSFGQGRGLYPKGDSKTQDKIFKDEESIKNWLDKNISDPIEGIWMWSFDNSEYYARTAIIKHNGVFKEIHLEHLKKTEKKLRREKGRVYGTFKKMAIEGIYTTFEEGGTYNVILNEKYMEVFYEYKVLGIKEYPIENKKIVKTGEWAGNGSGVIISKSGYIITNHHVIEDANDIEVEFVLNDEVQKFNAEIVQVDKTNDLAIVKIVDVNFDGVDELPYNFKTRSSDVGTKVYAFGYPMALSIMGKEIKVTDGMISSKTGFDGNITTYQITAPIQGGNSGGPLFDERGNLIGINSSGIRKDIADNVAYSIKTSYVLNLIDILPKSIELPSNTKLESLPLTEQIKEISKYVVLIKVK
jgi:V8-like Glu-specific endopeptidase